MKITDEAKSIIMKELTSSGCDGLRVKLQKSCCSVSLDFEPVKLKAKDKPVSINGISVIIDKRALTKAEKVILAVEDGELVLVDDVS